MKDIACSYEFPHILAIYNQHNCLSPHPTYVLRFSPMMEPFAIPLIIIVLVIWILYTITLNRRLIRNQNRYLQFFSDSPVALIVIDKNYQILEWNQTAEIIFGWKENEAKGHSIIELIVPIFDRSHVESTLAKATIEGISYSKNYNITQPGNEIFCEWRNRFLKKSRGEMLCMAQDITVSQKTLDDLYKRSTALESVGDAIIYTDDKGRIEFANRSFFALSLSDSSDLYGMHIGKYLFKERLIFNTLLPQFDIDNTWRGTINKSSDTGEKVLNVSISAIYRRKRLVSYVATLHDITQISSHVNTLTHRVQHDPLTGAINRATMMDRLIHAITRSNRSGKKVALFFIDLNDFKQVNDYYGHEAGDRMLRGVSENLRACLRNSDTVCRYGGDEFIILIEEVKSEEHLQSIRETIKVAIGEPIRLDNERNLYAKASVGLALYPDHAVDADELIRMADSSMYVIKRNKNTIES